MNIHATLRTFIEQLLSEHGHDEPFGDTDSLVISGLLDSLAVVHVVVMMEQTFGIDFSAIYFDQSDFDTIDSMVAFVEKNT